MSRQKRGRALDIGGFEVRLKITPEGDAAFQRYLEGLRAYLAVQTPVRRTKPGPDGR